VFRPPFPRGSGNRPEVDKTAEISAVSREEHHALSSGVADERIAQTIAAHADGTFQYGRIVFTSGRGIPAGSGRTVAELGDEAAVRVEHLDAAGVGVSGEDPTGSDVAGHAQRRAENEVARSDRASEMAYLQVT